MVEKERNFKMQINSINGPQFTGLYVKKESSRKPGKKMEGTVTSKYEYRPFQGESKSQIKEATGNKTIAYYKNDDYIPFMTEKAEIKLGKTLDITEEEYQHAETDLIAPYRNSDSIIAEYV